jgi:CRISPR-associated protein Csb1
LKGETQMALDPNPLDSASRLLVEATLHVAPGSGGRFQPTGFPDLGPALYKGVRVAANETNGKGEAETVDMLLVESVQSMANRLEEVCLQGEDYNADCQAIPYVRVLDGHRGNSFLTSSVREPHRLASPYVLGAKRNDSIYRDELKSALQANKQRPVHIWRMVPVIFERDPGCVLHGVFLEKIDGRIRLPRLVSAYIQASSPNQANSGGVYRGEVTAKDNIPYPRQEFTSPTITASFIFHLSTLKGYGLDDAKNRFLQTWALYKIDRFLREHLRLRTACEFHVADTKVTLEGPADQKQDIGGGNGQWPSSSDILDAFTRARDTCFPRQTEGDEWAQRRVTVVTYAVDIKGEAPLGDASTDSLDLAGFDGRAEVKEVTRKKQKVTVLELTGDWHDEEERQKLLDKNPETKVTADGEEAENPAHEVVKKALKSWDAAWKKLQKKMEGTEESGDEE